MTDAPEVTASRLLEASPGGINPYMQKLGHVVLTGAGGYIGRRVAAAARQRGCSVTALSRHGGGLADGIAQCEWTLGAPLPGASLRADLPPAAQAVIHLAHDWRNPEASADDPGGLNARGTRALRDSCRSFGVGRFVFVSSQSARADAANIYGRAKWAVEQTLDGPDEIAARVGLVYGGPRQAMFGLLCRLVQLAPVLPMIDPWREVQPIHLDEVAEGLLRLAEGRGERVIGLAAPEGIAFGRFLQVLAREFAGRRLAILPVPLRLALLACDVSARLPLVPTVDRERVLGLAGTRAMACAEDLRSIGLTLVPIAEGLRREPAARRQLLAEGRALLGYVLGRPAGSGLLRQYARGVAASGRGALAMPGMLRTFPSLVRLIEPIGGATDLTQRLRLASSIAESSPQGQSVLAGKGRFYRLYDLFRHMVLEALMWPARLVARKRP